MRCPELKGLPSPTEGKAGWPWTEECSQLPDLMPDGRPWPRISIVTPSYNQGQFIEETIRSVLLQGYSNLEYIIIDGGSSDKSIEVIKKYQRWINYWVSEPDRGQSHAINKGFQHASGLIMGWLNSDDMFLRSSLTTVGLAFDSSGFDVLSGHTILLDETGSYLRPFRAQRSSVAEMLRSTGGVVPQQSTFWTRSSWKKCGPLREDLHYVMDYYFWLCLAATKVNWSLVDMDLAVHRRHGHQKTHTMYYNNFERLKALRLFGQSKFFTHDYIRALRRALLYEGWLANWDAQYFLSQNRLPYCVYWLIAPFNNWRCLGMRAFYKNARLEIRRVISQIPQRMKTLMRRSR